MRAFIQIILTGILLLTCIPAISQEETAEEEKTFEWTDDLYWNPPKELLVGLEEIGELTTNRESLKMQRIYLLDVLGDYLYVYDQGLGKLLQFDLAGNFLKNVLTDDQVLSGYLRSMDIDDKGRILLSDQRSLHVITDGKIELFDNFHRLSSVVWGLENILGFNMYFSDRMEGIIKEVTLDGKNIATWGEAYREFDAGSMMMMSSLKRSGKNLILCDEHFNGFVAIDLETKQQKIIKFEIPAFARRIAQTQASIDYRNKTNSGSWRVFPVFEDFSVIGDRVYLFVTSKGFIDVIECDLWGKMQRVYRGLQSIHGGARAFAISEVDGKQRFFFTVMEQGEKGFVTKVRMFSPCDKVPTADDLKIAEAKKEKPKKEETEEDKKRKELYEIQRKAWGAYSKARQAADKAENDSEKRQIYYKLVEDYPEQDIASYALRSAVGREPSKEVAIEALEKLETALPKAEKQEVINNYKLLRMTLNSILGKAEEFRTDATELLNAEIRITDYYSFIRSAPRVENWQVLLEAMEAALSKSDPKSLMKLYRGMSEKDAKTRSDYYQCEFKKEKARALTHLGKVDEALAIFEEVSKNTECHYTGNFVNDLDQHWAVALHKAGKTDEAIDVLTPGVLFGGSEEKFETLKKIYAASSRSEVFDAYLAKKRNEMAIKIDDAQFYDYEKNPVKLSEKFGKATILTFWTPST